MIKRELVLTVPGANPEIVEPLADAVLSFWDALDAGQPADLVIYRDGTPSERISYVNKKRLMDRKHDIAGTFAVLVSYADERQGSLHIIAGDQAWKF